MSWSLTNSPPKLLLMQYMAFQYAHLLTKTCQDEMKRDGVIFATTFSQFLQNHLSTTGNSIKNLYRQFIKTSKDQQSPIKWSIIDQWPTHLGLIGSLFLTLKTHQIQACILHSIR
ncbi:ferrochelatase [Puccinia sorghi]|uniref:Ferrochelatase n=1 Tax=Puccinia sorghi TaxID=27349 RepID=A0A0L6UFM0_9BASI|nr:ferrochelatase [Puccinia sorghi]